MRKIIIMAGFATIFMVSNANASTWIVENQTTAKCEVSQYGPQDMIDELRSESIIPDIKIDRNPDNSILDVVLTFTEKNGDKDFITLFTSMPLCEQILDADEKSGIVVDPNELQ